MSMNMLVIVSFVLNIKDQYLFFLHGIIIDAVIVHLFFFTFITAGKWNREFHMYLTLA